MARHNSNSRNARDDSPPSPADARRTKIVRSAMSELIEHMERDDLPPWNKPWKAGSGGRNILLPKNATTDVQYSGGNRLILADRAMRYHWNEDGSIDNRWLTLKQAATIGGTLIEGQEGLCAHLIKIVKDTVTREVKNADGSKEDKTVGRTAARPFSVYHVSQFQGLDIAPPEPVVKPAAKPESELIVISQLGQDAIDAMVKRTNLVIRHGADVDDMRRGAGVLGSIEDAAFYSPAHDMVHMPRRELFYRDEDYFDTLFHELGHASMAQHRLDRKGAVHAFGSDGYAKEELVADLASAFWGAEIDLPASESRMKSHAAYIKNWKKQLSDDPQALFTAARVAEKICGYLKEQALAYRLELDQALAGPQAPDTTLILPGIDAAREAAAATMTQAMAGQGRAHAAAAHSAAPELAEERAR